MYNHNYRDSQENLQLDDLDINNTIEDIDDLDDVDFEDFRYPMGCPYRTPAPQMPPRPPFGGMGNIQSQGAPVGPPPNFTPPQTQAQALNFGGPTTYAVDPGALRPCRFRFVYLWLRNGRQYWAWLTYVGRTSAAGFRWNGRRWVYFGVDLRQIRSFLCY